MVCEPVLSMGLAATRPSRSRIPNTACLPTVPRPAFSFLDSCLGLFAADVGFVDLDLAVHTNSLNVESLSETVQEEPGRLLRDAQLLGQLHTADALTGRLKQVHGVQPFVQGNVGAFKDCASPHRELLAALFVVALVVVGLLHSGGSVAVAVTGNAVCPPASFYIAIAACSFG